MLQTTTDEISEELKARIKGFNEEVIVLLKKYELALGALPVILSDGRLAANPHVFDAIRTAAKAGDITPA